MTTLKKGWLFDWSLKMLIIWLGKLEWRVLYGSKARKRERKRDKWRKPINPSLLAFTIFFETNGQNCLFNVLFEVFKAERMNSKWNAVDTSKKHARNMHRKFAGKVIVLFTFFRSKEWTTATGAISLSFANWLIADDFFLLWSGAHPKSNAYNRSIFFPINILISREKERESGV